MIEIEDLKNLYGNGNEESISTIMSMTFKAGNKTVHNYNVEFYRKTGSTGRTKGWELRIYQCLNFSNSTDIEVFGGGSYKTLRYCKRLAVSLLNMWDCEQGDNSIYKYLSKNRKPVFKLDNGKPIIIGSTYSNLGYEAHSFRNNSGDRYYFFDTPLTISFRNQKAFSIQDGSLRGIEKVFEYVEFSGSGYVHGYENDISSLSVFNKGRLISQVESAFSWWCKNNPITKINYTSGMSSSNDSK